MTVKNKTYSTFHAVFSTGLLTLSLLVALASCVREKDAEALPGGEQPLLLRAGTVKSSTVTRSESAIDGPVLPDDYTIYLSASLCEGDEPLSTLFDGEPFMYDDGLWHATPARYWPFGERLSFSAIATDTAVLPHLASQMYWDRHCCTDEVVIDVPEEATGTEILYGLSFPDYGDHSPVDMPFRHSQACLSFRFTADIDSVVRIDGITINDIRTKGLFTMRDMGATDASGDAKPLVWWQLTGQPHNFDMTDIFTRECKARKKAEGQPDKLYDYRILRHYDATDAVASRHRFDALIPEQERTSFTLHYTVRANRSCDFDTQGDHCEYTVTLDPLMWEMGTMYIYDINIGVTDITVVPYIGDWDPCVRTIFVDEAVVELNTTKSLFVNEFGELAADEGIRLTYADGTPVPSDEARVSVSYYYDSGAGLGTVEITGDDILPHEQRYSVVLTNTIGAQAFIPVSVKLNEPQLEEISGVRVGAIHDTKREILPRQTVSVRLTYADASGDPTEYISAYVRPVPDIVEGQTSALLYISGIKKTEAPLGNAFFLEAFNADGQLVYRKPYGLTVSQQAADNVTVQKGGASLKYEIQLPPNAVSVDVTHPGGYIAVTASPVQDADDRKKTLLEISGIEVTPDNTTEDITLVARDASGDALMEHVVAVSVSNEVPVTLEVNVGFMEKYLISDIPGTAVSMRATVTAGSAYVSAYVTDIDGTSHTATLIIGGIKTSGGISPVITLEALDANGGIVSSKTVIVSDVKEAQQEITLPASDDASVTVRPDLPPSAGSMTFFYGAVIITSGESGAILDGAATVTLGNVVPSENPDYIGLGCKACDITLKRSGAGVHGTSFNATIFVYDGDGRTVLSRNIKVKME